MGNLGPLNSSDSKEKEEEHSEVGEPSTHLLPNSTSSSLASTSSSSTSARATTAEPEPEPEATKAAHSSIPVERIHVRDISAEEFEKNYVQRAIPVVLRGLVDTWTAYKDWSTTYFQENWGDLDVKVAFGNKDSRKMKLKDYLANYENYEREHRASGKASPYLKTWNFLDECPDMESMFDATPYFRDLFKKFPKRMRPPFSWLFLGPPGVVTLPHEDIWHTDAWIAQLEGSKLFHLYHPGQRKYLENVNLGNEGEEGRQGSGEELESEFVDPWRPDLIKFPNFKKAQAIEALLEKGDVLYIPRRWPHHSIGLSRSVSLTENFFSKTNKQVVIPLWESYVQRKIKCEKILGRTLRASDNLLKFCVHGGKLPASLVLKILNAYNEGDNNTSSVENSDANGEED